MNFNCSDKSSTKLEYIVNSLVLISIYDKQFLLEKFVGLNDWHEGYTQSKRTIKILNNTIRRFYSNKNNQKIEGNNNKKIMRAVLIKW